jgi:hypothetical protein
MSGAVELWSQPWHELQRHLAAAAAVCTGGDAAGAGGLAAHGLTSKPYAGTVTPTGSWMVRKPGQGRLGLRPAAR